MARVSRPIHCQLNKLLQWVLQLDSDYRNKSILANPWPVQLGAWQACWGDGPAACQWQALFTGSRQAAMIPVTVQGQYT